MLDTIISEKPVVTGTHTLLRGLTLLECVANGTNSVKEISLRMGIPRSTVNRMLASLVIQGYLHRVPYKGYTLGSKLIYLGSIALEQRPLVALARPHLELLAAHTEDTVHLGVEDEDQVLYLDKIPSKRGLEMRSRIGLRKPIASTGVGKALLLGIHEERWLFFYKEAVADQKRLNMPHMLPPWKKYRQDLLDYVSQGWVYDIEEHEPGIRCVGAPVYDVLGKVVAAVSVASADHYMDFERMRALGPVVRETACAISRDLGWLG